MLRLLKTFFRQGDRFRGRQAYRVLLAITEPRRTPAPGSRRVS
jgi:hypothetical protein